MSDSLKTTAKKKRLGEFLLENGLIEPEDLEKALDEQRQTGKKLGEALVSLGLVTDSQLVQMLAIQLGYKAVELSAITVDPEVLLSIPQALAGKHQVFPIKFEGRALTVAMADPLDYECIRDLSFHSGYRIRPVLCTRQEILEAIAHHYAKYNSDPSLEQLVRETTENLDEAEMIQVLPEVGIERDEILELEERSRLAPIIRLANMIFSASIKRKASDIHIEPGSKDCVVRFRIDGLLRQEMRVPRWVQGALASRIKVLSSLDIAERRQPQDGAVRLKVDDKEIDLRVSVLPTQYGEKIVIRILDQARIPTSMDELGLSAHQLEQIDHLVRHKKGILLVTGPTGSGKTTLLYTLINKLKSETINITTVENPIEYSLEGINQVQIHPEAGLTFAKCLRSILRQDPNVILIGEIRDLETAEIAFRAAMTGHLVLSTLHTNDAPSTISRLVDIGVPRYMAASQLIGVIAQRLIRCLCPKCKEPMTEPDEDIVSLNIPQQILQDAALYRAKGCPQCQESGYSGRTGIFEFLELDPFLRELMLTGAPEQQLRSSALAAGMVGLQEAAFQKLREGLTSAAEIARVIETEEQLQTFCQQCARPLTFDFIACPYCAAPARHRCPACTKPIQADWRLCPYCRHNFEHA